MSLIHIDATDINIIDEIVSASISLVFFYDIILLEMQKKYKQKVKT